MTPITSAALDITLLVEKIIRLPVSGMQLLTWLMLFSLHQFVRTTGSYLLSPARINYIFTVLPQENINFLALFHNIFNWDLDCLDISQIIHGSIKLMAYKSWWAEHNKYFKWFSKAYVNEGIENKLHRNFPHHHLCEFSGSLVIWSMGRYFL